MTKTILVVDDEKRITSLLKAYLEQQGFGVATVCEWEGGTVCCPAGET